MAATQADVDAAEQALRDIVSRGLASYTVEGVTFTPLTLDAMRRHIAQMRLEVASTAGRHSSVIEFGPPD